MWIACVVSPRIQNANAFVLKSGINFFKNTSYTFLKAQKNVIKMDLMPPFLWEVQICLILHTFLVSSYIFSILNGFSVALESWSWLYMCSIKQLWQKFVDILSTEASQWHHDMMNLFEVQTFSPINTKPASNSDFWRQKNTSSCALSLQGTSYTSAKAGFFSFRLNIFPVL